MDVEVTLGPEDLRALQRRLRGTTSFSVSGIILALILGLGAFSLWTGAILSDVDDRVIAQTALLVVVFVVFACGAFAGGAAAWRFAQMLGVRESLLVQGVIDRFLGPPWRLAITPEGANVESARFSAFYRWAYFTDLIQTGDHLFLFAGRYEALVVPRHAFATDRAFLTFAESCRSFFDRPPAPHPPIRIQTRSDEFTHGSPDR